MAPVQIKKVNMGNDKVKKRVYERARGKAKTNQVQCKKGGQSERLMAVNSDITGLSVRNADILLP